MGHNPFFDAGTLQGAPPPRPNQLNCHDAAEYLGLKCEPKPQRQ